MPALYIIMLPPLYHSSTVMGIQGWHLLSSSLVCTLNLNCAFMWTSSKIIVTIPSKTKFGKK